MNDEILRMLIVLAIISSVVWFFGTIITFAEQGNQGQTVQFMVGSLRFRIGGAAGRLLYAVAWPLILLLVVWKWAAKDVKWWLRVDKMNGDDE